MAIPFLTNINLSDNELQNSKLHLTGSNPTSAQGQFYLNSSTNKFRVYTTSWQNVAFESWVSSNFNNYSLPLAADGTRGGIQIGYTENGKNYPVELSSEKAFVNVPWTDTTTNETITLSGDVSGSGTSSINVTIASDAVEGSMLNDNVISGQTALTSGLASTDELLISDAGTIKRMDVSVLQTYMQNNLSIASGDITAVNITAGDGLTGTVNTSSGTHTQTIDVVGGDGITANADEIEVAVDDTTIELSASNGSGQVRAKTAAIADGGTALATADQIHTFVTGYADASGTDNSTDVTLAGSLDYITISGQVITRNAIVLTTDVSGTLPIANGGTGQTSAAAAANALLNTSQGGSLTIGNGSDEIVIPGDLTVTGTTTTNNVEVISTSNGVVFEGNAADANELTLLAGTLTADRTVTLPDATGTVALTSDLHDAVTLSGSYDYITLSGQVITVGQVDYNTDISNTPTIPTVNNATITLAAGNSGITMDADNAFTTNQSTNETITISHADTSSQASVNNSGLTVIQDVTLDTYGHVTGLTSSDITDDVISAGRKRVVISGDGTETSFTVQHDFGTPFVSCQLLDYGNAGTGATYEVVYADIRRSDDNNITVEFATAPSSTQDYVALMVKF